MRGTLAGGTFFAHHRIGSLDGSVDADGELERRRNAARARRLMRDWERAWSDERGV